MTPRWHLSDLPLTRRLSIRFAVAYVVLLLFLVALGLEVSPVLLGAVFLVAMAGLGFALSSFGESLDDPWTTTRPSTVGLGRGSDHLTVALGRRLAVRDADPVRQANLAAELHRQLRAVVVHRVQRERGVDLASRPDLADDVLPPDLAVLVTEPANPRLTDPGYLRALLDRIEPT